MMLNLKQEELEKGLFVGGYKFSHKKSYTLIIVGDLQKPVNDDTKCQEKCNENLKTGLDMVKVN
jgi:hypothetical protein